MDQLAELFRLFGLVWQLGESSEAICRMVRSCSFLLNSLFPSFQDPRLDLLGGQHADVSADP